MSIIIKGKTKPDFCYHCWFCRQNHFPARFDTFYECILMEQEISGGFIPSDCPLIEIPTPHGRIVDELKRHREEYANDHGWNTSVLEALDIAITILKTEE